MTDDRVKTQMAALAQVIRSYVEDFAQQVRPRLKEIDDLRARVDALERRFGESAAADTRERGAAAYESPRRRLS